LEIRRQMAPDGHDLVALDPVRAAKALNAPILGLEH